MVFTSVVLTSVLLKIRGSQSLPVVPEFSMNIVLGQEDSPGRADFSELQVPACDAVPTIFPKDVSSTESHYT